MSWANIAAYYQDGGIPETGARASSATEARLRRLVDLSPVLLAAIIRLVLLGMKPPHFDEGVNGWFVDEMTKKGFYHYDPANYHGPLHFYVLFLFQTLFGRHIWTLRLPIVAISTATVYLVTRFERFLDRRLCLFAAFAMAVSPGAVFYSRYAIHEAWLVFFLILTVWGFAGLWKWGNRPSLWAVGLGITGMILTKETYVIHLACFGLAALCMAGLEPFSPSLSPPSQIRWRGGSGLRYVATTSACLAACGIAAIIARDAPLVTFGKHAGLIFMSFAWQDRVSLLLLAAGGLVCLAYSIPFLAGLTPRECSPSDLAIVTLVCFGLILFFYSGGLLDYSSLKGLYQTYYQWFKTGKEGHGHEKAWYYWLQLMAIYEWPALIGVGCSVRYLLPGSNRLLRFLAIYGCGALAAYSIIPYKTPWCIISILWPFFFLFGGFIEDFAELLSGRDRPATVLAACATLLLAFSAAESVRLNFFRYVDPEEKYVYVQTLPDIYKLTGPLNKMTALSRGNYQLEGNILLSSYHPLPWVLGDFPHIGYYSGDMKPDKMDADFLLVEASRVDEVEKALKNSYFTTDLQLRDGQDSSKLFLDADKFAPLFPGQDPDFDPDSDEP
jgi:hypothetical protein